MYQIDDIVVYGMNGVCKLVDITDKDCGGKMVTYYVLSPFSSANSTVFVPVNNKKLTAKLRNILTKDEIELLIDEIPKRTDTWIDNERQRKEYYKDLLGRADAGELLKLLQLILQQQEKAIAKGKKLHMCDERMLEDAGRMIEDEFSYVLHLTPEETKSYIMKRIA